MKAERKSDVNKRKREVEIGRLERFIFDRDQLEVRTQKLSSLVNGLDEEALYSEARILKPLQIQSPQNYKIIKRRRTLCLRINYCTFQFPIDCFSPSFGIEECGPGQRTERRKMVLLSSLRRSSY